MFLIYQMSSDSEASKPGRRKRKPKKDESDLEDTGDDVEIGEESDLDEKVDVQEDDIDEGENEKKDSDDEDVEVEAEVEEPDNGIEVIEDNPEGSVDELDQYDKHVVSLFKKSQGTRIAYERIVTGDNRRISNVMPMCVYTAVVSLRTKHISSGSPSFIDWKALNLTNAEDIAVEEIKQGKCPLKVRIPIGNKKEEWRVNEMIPPPDIPR
jgi:DNA-directed RNA polymerase subunit K/omega